MSFDARKPVVGGFANIKGSGQPAHPRSLISAFVIRLLESIISRLATFEISIFKLASVTEQTVLISLCRKPRRQVYIAQIESVQCFCSAQIESDTTRRWLSVAFIKG